MTATALGLIVVALFCVAVTAGLIASGLRKFAHWSVPSAVFGASCICPLIFAIYSFLELRYAQGIADGDPTAGILEFAFVAIPLMFVSSLGVLSGWELFKKRWR